MKIDIIGGGIGGLSTAIALKRKGFEVMVHEQAAKMRAVGAGIILANNAMQVYDRFGMKERMEEAGNLISFVQILRGRDLRVLSRVAMAEYEQEYGVRNVAIHRGKLQELLLEELGSEQVVLDRRLKGVKLVKNGFVLSFENGETMDSDYVIGADGINSVVRKELFGAGEIRDAKQACWRGVTEFELPEKYQSKLSESWGIGGRFGFTKIAPKQVYWFALKNYQVSLSEANTDNWMEDFKDYDPMVREILASTPKETIHLAPITDLKPISVWVRGNACLMGDAAHATTPNMGQGACQAIEDAYILGECMAKYPVREAFDRFQKIRLKKAHMIVNRSWGIGKVAQLENTFLIGMRNLGMRAVPQRLSKGQMKEVFALEEV